MAGEFMKYIHEDIFPPFIQSSCKILVTYNLPQALKKRGLDEADKLPNFYYRDDSLKLWAAIGKFVNDILAIYYRSDDNVVKVNVVYQLDGRNC